jgi:hypothetical protein
MTFTIRLELEDGSRAEPPTLKAAVPNRRPGDTSEKVATSGFFGAYPLGIEPTRGTIKERAGGPARQPDGRPAKVHRLSLDGAQDAFLPGWSSGSARPLPTGQKEAIARAI